MIEALRKGRAQEFAYFDRAEEPPDPVAGSTRDRAVLSWDWSDPTRVGLRRLYRDLFRLRRELPALRDPRHARTRLIDGGDVLEAVRGGDGEEIRIYFNLAAEDRALPTNPWRPSCPHSVGGRGLRHPRGEADRRFTGSAPTSSRSSGRSTHPASRPGRRGRRHSGVVVRAFLRIGRVGQSAEGHPDLTRADRVEHVPRTLLGVGYDKRHPPVPSPQQTAWSGPVSGFSMRSRRD